MYYDLFIIQHNGINFEAGLGSARLVGKQASL